MSLHQQTKTELLGPHVDLKSVAQLTLAKHHNEIPARSPERSALLGPNTLSTYRPAAGFHSKPQPQIRTTTNDASSGVTIAEVPHVNGEATGYRKDAAAANAQADAVVQAIRQRPLPPPKEPQPRPPRHQSTYPGLWYWTSSMTTYPALLSFSSIYLRRQLSLGDRSKNGVEYKHAFDGKEAVDKLAELLDSKDRRGAIRLGRALGAQRLFHDVNYEHGLTDSTTEVYQFHNAVPLIRSISSSLDSDSGLSIHSDRSTRTVSDQSRLATGPAFPFVQSIPNGVMTELTHCYSPTCTLDQPCYSFACPKRRRSEKEQLSGMHQSMASSDKLPKYPLWIETVSASTRESLSRKEYNRQEAIHELIMTESMYVADLEHVIKMWMQPLRASNHLQPKERREAFIETVFTNIHDIHHLNIEFAESLKRRQMQTPIIVQIGDIVLDYVMKLDPYIEYGRRQHEAKLTFDQERITNPEFAHFVDMVERHFTPGQMELNGYLTKPTSRLGKYTILLSRIIKYTPAEHPDRERLANAKEIVQRFLSHTNVESGKARSRLDLARIYHRLSFKNKSDDTDLKLLDADRLLIREGSLYKTPSVDSSEYHVILLDHYLVITKIKMSSDGSERYVVQKKPIPIEFLSVKLPDRQYKRSTSHILPIRAAEESVRASSDMMRGFAHRHTSQSRGVNNLTQKSIFPIVFRHIGRVDLGETVLYASSFASRKAWADTIQKQQAVMDVQCPVFSVQTLAPYLSEAGRINQLSTFFNGQFYLLATDHGVYCERTDHSSAPRRVLALEKVSQVHALEKYQLLLVLADRTLWEYDLQEVVNQTSVTTPVGKRVQCNVPYFYVGQSLGRTLVCVPRVSSLKTTITLYEPSSPQEHPSRKSSWIDRLALPTRTSPSASPGVHLRRFKDCYLPSEAWAIELSPSQLMITCPHGMVLVDLRTNRPQQMLNPEDKHLQFITVRERPEMTLQIRSPMKHISVFRIRANHFLVCYDEFAFYIDSGGNRTHPDFLIEWEGRPDAFAYVYPYVLAFEGEFIEVRNIMTGQLEQIIRGSGMRCLHHGYKAEHPLVAGTMIDPSDTNRLVIFSLKQIPTLPQTPQSMYDSQSEPSTYGISTRPP